MVAGGLSVFKVGYTVLGYTTLLRVSVVDQEKRFVCHDIFIDGILYQTYNIPAIVAQVIYR